jgi:uncharacterized protein (TIGR04255 family)
VHVIRELVTGILADAEHETDGPLGGLPAADPTLLGTPPLEVAIVEVRFQAKLTAVPADVGLRVRELAQEAGFDFPRLEQALQQQMQVQFGPDAGPPEVQVQAQGWQFHSADSFTQATLLPGTLVVQTSRYERWSISLRPVLEMFLAAIDVTLRPELTYRLGLRYVDRFVGDASSPADWSGRIDEHLLGAVTHPVLGDRVVSSQQQVELALGPAQGALLRHGPFRDDAEGGKTSYLLDIDVFDGATTAFDASETVTRAERLNRTALALFQNCLTGEYLKVLQGGVK